MNSPFHTVCPCWAILEKFLYNYGGCQCNSDTPADYVAKVNDIISSNCPAEDGKEIADSLYKAHPIEPITDGNQPMILRFPKHYVVKKLYLKRKLLKNKCLSLQPSLTQKRSLTLKRCKEIVEQFRDIVDFLFADIEGNLKICFKQPHTGRNIHVFSDEKSSWS